MGRRARLIAFYLPQFHPIPENDTWWGKGFTEWTNVARARPLFKGHYQPRLPADLGYYDLRVPEIREMQAELARNAGIEGFCYYHYWFGGKRLLERPFTEVVASGAPNLPFCLCWANETWTGVWHGAPGRILIKQTYPGREDNQKHFLELRAAFHDPRYLRLDSRPIFIVFRPMHPEISGVIRDWQELAVQSGLRGLHFVAHLEYHEAGWDYKSRGFSSCIVAGTHKVFRVSMSDLLAGDTGNGPRRFMQFFRGANAVVFEKELLGNWLWRRYRSFSGQFNNVRLYRHALPFLLDACREGPGIFPCVIPNWDNTPRSQVRAHVMHDSTPELFRAHLREALNLVKSQDPRHRLVFIKAWNEWAEGNYLEPDEKFGHDYLRVVREEISCAASACETADGQGTPAIADNTFQLK